MEAYLLPAGMTYPPADQADGTVADGEASLASYPFRHMAVPDYQTLMRPLLAHYENGAELPIRKVRAELAADFQLTDEELAEMIPSGRARLFVNRVGWATTYLFQSGLLDRPRRAVYRITDRGRRALVDNPTRIDVGVLQQFDEPGPPAPPEPDADTPEERIGHAYAEFRDALAGELLQRVNEQHPDFLEDLVLDVLVAMGYGGSRDDAATRLGKTGDGGVDGVIREDVLGLDAIYVQAKRWTNQVGSPQIAEFVGALQGQGATKGVFITTSTFSGPAREFAEKVHARIVLIDGPALANLMIDHGVGVAAGHSYSLLRIDDDYFDTDE